MTILSVTQAGKAAAPQVEATVTRASPQAAAADAEMGSLFKADLAKASQAAEKAPAAETAKPGVPEKSVSTVYRGSRSGVMSPNQQFESFVLRNFVDSMLPSDEGSYFGTGSAGKIWKSMLAERIGDEMAKDGGIGIADMLEKRGAKAAALDGAKDEMKRSEALTTGAQAFKGLGSL